MLRHLRARFAAEVDELGRRLGGRSAVGMHGMFVGFPLTADTADPAEVTTQVPPAAN